MQNGETHPNNSSVIASESLVLDHFYDQDRKGLKACTLFRNNFLLSYIYNFY